MARIQCFYEDCRFLRNGICTAEIIELTAEDGCLTYVMKEAPPQIMKWSDDDIIEIEDTWNEVGFEEREESEYWDDEY